MTPLLMTAEKGHLGVVQLLVERGADKEAKDNVRCAAPSLAAAAACCIGTDASAQRCALQKQGASAREGRNWRRPPLISGGCQSVARRAHSRSITLFLLHMRAAAARQSSPLSRCDACAMPCYDDAATASLSAAALRCRVIAQNGMTPLHMAAEYGHVACVALLVECGANKDAKNRVRCAAPSSAALLRAAPARLRLRCAAPCRNGDGSACGLG
jgi:hypothetical protein